LLVKRCSLPRPRSGDPKVRRQIRPTRSELPDDLGPITEDAGTSASEQAIIKRSGAGRSLRPKRGTSDRPGGAPRTIMAGRSRRLTRTTDSEDPGRQVDYVGADSGGGSLSGRTIPPVRGQRQTLADGAAFVWVGLRPTVRLKAGLTERGGGT
jgi:hypothetical protein